MTGPARLSTMARWVSAKWGDRETRARRLAGRPTQRRKNSKMPSAGDAVLQHLGDQFQRALAGHLHDRHDQALLVGEAAVEGPDTDAGPLGDPFHGRLVPTLGKDVLGRHQDPLQVELGVTAQGAGQTAPPHSGRHHSTPEAEPTTGGRTARDRAGRLGPVGSCTGCRGISSAVPAAIRSATAEITKARM